MKHTTIILLVCIALAFSNCSRSPHTASPIPSSNISGLTSISQSYDTNTAALEHVTWTFTGANPITVTPTSYSGGEQLIFTGSNVTKLIYTLTNVPGAIPEGLTINITYNSAGQIDTLTILHTTDTSYGNEKYAFKYYAGQLLRVTLGHQYTSTGLFDWAHATTYYFTYTGNNISQVNVSINYQASGHDTATYKYFTDSRNNNFSGSYPTYFILNYIEGRDDLLHRFPMYINANLTDSMQTIDGVGNVGTTTYKTIVDTTGRITMRITDYTTPFPDTTVFHY